MAGIPSREEIDAEKGITYTGRKCPKCGSEIHEFAGGDQGGVAFEYCSSNDCKYEKY